MLPSGEHCTNFIIKAVIYGFLYKISNLYTTIIPEDYAVFIPSELQHCKFHTRTSLTWYKPVSHEHCQASVKQQRNLSAYPGAADRARVQHGRQRNSHSSFRHACRCSRGSVSPLRCNQRYTSFPFAHVTAFSLMYPRFEWNNRALSPTTRSHSYGRCTHRTAYTHALSSCFILLLYVRFVFFFVWCFQSVLVLVSYFPVLCVFVLCAGVGYLLRSVKLYIFFSSCMVVWVTYFVLV